MTTHDAAQVRRRFLLLPATRWLPTGLTIPVLIVLLQERGLSLATIGLLSGLGSAVVALLELPTVAWPTRWAGARCCCAPQSSAWSR
jgi:hypothetical protein